PFGDISWRCTQFAIVDGDASPRVQSVQRILQLPASCLDLPDNLVREVLGKAFQITLWAYRPPHAGRQLGSLLVDGTGGVQPVASHVDEARVGDGGRQRWHRQAQVYALEKGWCHHLPGEGGHCVRHALCPHGGQRDPMTMVAEPSLPEPPLPEPKGFGRASKSSNPAVARAKHGCALPCFQGRKAGCQVTH